MVESNASIVDGLLCDGCQKTFSSKKTLNKHVKFTCKKNDPLSKSIVKSDSLKVESSTNADEQKDVLASNQNSRKTVVAFECDFCSKLFRSKEVLVKHLSEIHADEEYESDEEEEVDNEIDTESTRVKDTLMGDSKESSEIVKLEEKISSTQLEVLKFKANSVNEITNQASFLQHKLQLLQSIIERQSSVRNNKDEMKEFNTKICKQLVSRDVLNTMIAKKDGIAELEENMNLLNVKMR